ncbi:hypothetical protein M9434_004388 [Picochlorum sp. BPE23]|nr:hypothetical protein M9434_004388 [Picochlorum sp. BPE23]
MTKRWTNRKRSFVCNAKLTYAVPALVLIFVIASSIVISSKDTRVLTLNRKDVGRDKETSRNTISLAEIRDQQQHYCESLESIPDTISSRNLGRSFEKGVGTMNLRKSALRTRNGSYAIYTLSQKGYHDIVSHSIHNSQRWEISDVTAVLQKLRLAVEGKSPQDIYLLDIGANIGVFTLNAAASGFNVLSFEAFRPNQEALLMSICANQVFDRVTILKHALGDGKACGLYSDKNNALNGFISCSEREHFSGSNFMHEVKTYALDELMLNSVDKLVGRVGVLKIDVEGFEPKVFQGGSNFISLIKPRYILTEINSEMLSRGSNTTVKEYIHQIMRLGYRPKKRSFDGPELTEKDIDGIDMKQQSLAHNETILLNMYFEAM